MDTWALEREEIHEDLCQVMDIFLNGRKFKTVDNKLYLNEIFSDDWIWRKIWSSDALLTWLLRWIIDMTELIFIYWSIIVIGYKKFLFGLLW
jgi:hypothetical protein